MRADGGHEDEEHVAQEGDEHAVGGVVRQPALPQGAAAQQAREHEPQAAEHEPGAGAAGDAQLLTAIDGQIVAQHSEAVAEEHHVGGQQPSAQQEEAVEGETGARGCGCGGARRCGRAAVGHGGVDEEPEGGDGQCEPEEEPEMVGLRIDEDGEGGGEGHGQVVGQSVVAYSLVAARGGQHVDGYGGVGHGDGAEGSAVQRAHDGEQQEAGGGQVSGKEDGEGGVGHEEHRLAREGVDQIAAEGAEQECGEGVAREHQPDGVLRGAEGLVEIEGQQGGEQVEGEEERKVGGHHLAVVGVPEWFHRWCHWAGRAA